MGTQDGRTNGQGSNKARLQNGVLIALVAGVLANFALTLLGPSVFAGTQGSIGAINQVGPQGEQGARGPIGPQGEQGVPGDTGSTGPEGETGARGPTGPQGDTGAIGAVGPLGPLGETGATGSPGIQGEMGPAGPGGSQGVRGSTGATGAQGPTGLAGPQGDPGETAVVTNPVVTLSSADGLFAYTGSPISTSVLAIDSLRVVAISGNFSTVTNFGSGQLQFALPFVCAVENDGAQGHIHDSAKSNNYVIVGECEAGSSMMKLFFIDSKSKILPLTPTSLITLTIGESFTLHAVLISQS